MARLSARCRGDGVAVDASGQPGEVKAQLPCESAATGVFA